MEQQLQMKLDGNELYIGPQEEIDLSGVLTTEEMIALSQNFQTAPIEVIEPAKTKTVCKHCVKIKSFKTDYVSYCSKCGKILSVRHKKQNKKGE